MKPMLIVSPKFPEGTIAGLYKRAVAENQFQDAVRFGQQKINWTLKEFDVINLIIKSYFRDTHQLSLSALLKMVLEKEISLLCGSIRLIQLKFLLLRYSRLIKLNYFDRWEHSRLVSKLLHSTKRITSMLWILHWRTQVQEVSSSLPKHTSTMKRRQDKLICRNWCQSFTHSTLVTSLI